ncbi:hypothetical protein LX32DRAFT_626348 [Colletotrichum zoysiae]|uniref:Uncharacterized protein n=1 Tax=Colletotrichum zoysiae TaxID=1216348 RepID=A0AAD9H8J1_9PEZI|nr:hypothetical protein LX32DRAFT_626348 [Colletotrichum zoysiae]
MHRGEHLWVSYLTPASLGLVYGAHLMISVVCSSSRRAWSPNRELLDRSEDPPGFAAMPR